jgi:predicted DNA-binding transcriptional regulator YafY
MLQTGSAGMQHSSGYRAERALHRDDYSIYMNRTDRLMAILLEFQARGELRAEDLSRRFEVSVRTMYRDLQAISESGVPLIATPGKGYRLLEGYFLPPLSFTSAEAAVLALGGEFVRTRVDPALGRAAEGALSKLLGVLPHEGRADVQRWQRELAFTSMRPGSDTPGLADLRSAIREQRVVRLLYHTYRQAQAERRDIEPTRLIHLGDTWHVAAYCRLRQAPRLFRLDRADEVEVLSERFVLGSRHEPRASSLALPSGAGEARVRVDPAVERWLRERQSFLFLREEFDLKGPVFVYALRDEAQLLPWLLGWGAAVEVLAPASLRGRLAQEATAILAKHALPLDSSEHIEPARDPAIRVSGAST